jgi:hypothetical protein
MREVIMLHTSLFRRALGLRWGPGSDGKGQGVISVTLTPPQTVMHQPGQ